MKKIIVLTSAVAALTVTAGTVITAKVVKAKKAEKTEAIELQKEAASTEAITEEFETYESEPVPVTDEAELEMCEEYKAEEEAKSEEQDSDDDNTLYNIYVEYCPRLEDGELCKEKHDTRLKFGDARYTNIFVKRTRKDHEDTSASFTWENHPGIIDAITEYFELTEWLTERDLKFVIDFVGYDWGSPLIMAHVGNDPKRSILIRASRITEEDVF